MTEKESLEDYLLEQLQTSGLPLEIEVADLLEDRWHVSNNEAYLDEDEGKTRDIDVFAIHKTETDQLRWLRPPRLFLATDLAVECKRSESHAWVFPTRKKLIPPGLGSGQTLDFLQVFSNRNSSFLRGKLLELPKLHFDTINQIAHAGLCPRTERKEGSVKRDRDEIFQATSQLMKFSHDFLRGYGNRIATNPAARHVVFLFLTIAFDGPLYEARTKNGKWSLKPTSHVLLRTGRYSKTFGDYDTYLVDIVTKEHLAKHIDIIENDIGLLMNKFTFEAQNLTARADAAVRALPSLPQLS
jgi:hypothetical protein